jgi:hypothetical protein
MVIGEPLEVPAEGDESAVECARQDLERRLAVLERRALQIAGH